MGHFIIYIYIIICILLIMDRRWLYFSYHKSYWIDPKSIQSVAVSIGYRLWISFLSLHENRPQWIPYLVIQLQHVQQRCQWSQHCRISCSLSLVIVSDLKGASVCSDFDKTSNLMPAFHTFVQYEVCANRVIAWKYI